MWYEVCDTDSYITWPYQIADHNCKYHMGVYTQPETPCIYLYDSQ